MMLIKNIFQLYAHVSIRRRWQLVGLLLLILFGALAEMATLGAVLPFLALLGNPSIFDEYSVIRNILVILGGPLENILLGATVAFCLIAVTAGVIRILLRWVSLRISYGLGADIGGEVYRRTLYQPYSWHILHNTSEIISSVAKVDAVVGGVVVPLLDCAAAAIVGFSTIIFLVIINPKIALIAGLGFLIIYGVTSFFLSRKLVLNSKIISRNYTERMQALQEGLGGIRDILLDNAQVIYSDKFSKLDYSVRRSQAINGFISTSPRYIIESVGMILISFVAYWSTNNLGGFYETIPALGALALGAQKLLPQMQLIYFGWASIKSNEGNLNDVIYLIDRSIPVQYLVQEKFEGGEKSAFKNNRDVKKILNPNRGGIPIVALKNMSFRYGDSPEILRNINIDIYRGGRIGIIGKTGVGKSTLVDIIMGLLTPTKGSVLIDGYPLDENSIRAWQKRISHVPQSIYLSDNSIAENIAFGIPADQIDMELVREVAVRSQLNDFVENLPEQYSTIVGERGVLLSGGQRQRIGLARALYKKTDVLILDEATNALDSVTENYVMQAIDRLSADLTVIMIAHRMSTLEGCDVILEITSEEILIKEKFNLNG